MKQPKKLPRDLKIAVSAHNLNPKDWMLLKDDGGDGVIIIHREIGETRIISRNVKPRKGGGV